MCNMNVVFTSLEALILKATNAALPCPDEAALEAFCAIMREASDGTQLAAQALAARIHSSNPREALLALSMLDRCMRRGSSNFHAEIGKFRFLNEMIKLVSPKYCASKTAPEVQTMVLQLLHAWSIEYPKESKFKVAYDMLKNQGVVKETPPPLLSEDACASYRNRPKSVIFDDEEKSKLLQRLLQSKKPEDLQHANRLIKTMVREEERRGEDGRRTVCGARERAALLRAMLARAAAASPDERLLMHELHAGCAALPPALRRLAESPDLVGEHLDDVLRTYEMLEEVLQQYKQFAEAERKMRSIKSDSGQINKVQASNSESLLDFAGAALTNNQTPEASNSRSNNAIVDLGDIFTTTENNIAEPLQPINLRQNDVDMKSDKTNKLEGWDNLDSLGAQMLKESLPANAKRVDNFLSKSAKKIPMNALEKASPKDDMQHFNNGGVLDLDFFTAAEPAASTHLHNNDNSALDDIMVDISEPLSPVNETNATGPKHDSPLDTILDLGSALGSPQKEESNKNGMENSVASKIVASDVKPLTDINITLQSVKPSKLPPIKAFEEDDGVTVTLHFCKDKPRPDVNVIVISTTSKNTSQIDDFKFQPVVPKGCKVRLLPASGGSLPAATPFLPPPALTQIMLLARPATTTTFRLKFVITYTCNDENYSEIGEVAALPLDEI